MTDEAEADGREPVTEPSGGKPLDDPDALPRSPLDPPAAGEPVVEPDTVEGSVASSMRSIFEGASAGQRVADAVPVGIDRRGRGLQNETATAAEVFTCPAATHTEPAERCAAQQFERAPVLGLMTDGRELATVYMCCLCGATYTFNRAAGEFDQVRKPRWQQ